MGPRAAGDPADALPWPNLRGKRCLVLVGAGGPDLAAEVARRGAAGVDTSPAGAPYDVTVAWRALHGAPDAAAAARTLAASTRGVLVSCEPLDLWLSLTARGRAVFTLLPGGDGVPLGFNGAGHRRLLEDAGFALERVTKPFVVPDGSPPRSGLEALAVRALAGTTDPGVLHRAVLARPIVPASAHG